LKDGKKAGLFLVIFIVSVSPNLDTVDVALNSSFQHPSEGIAFSPSTISAGRHPM
jgi:hypothetical protein